MLLVSVVVAVVLFAIFPLTDTDIWWHLACAREWVTTWTPVREPVVNVHEFFQLAVAFIYDIGGAPLLVAFKAVLWGGVFALFLLPECCKNHASGRDSLFKACRCVSRKSVFTIACVTILLFIFRYQFEIRPVLFSLLFLGIYWNVLPKILNKSCEINGACLEETSEVCCSKKLIAAALILALQWLWCKCQGLYILGPMFALAVTSSEWWYCYKAGRNVGRKHLAAQAAFVVLLFAMPFLHGEGLNLFLYPFGLLDRLLGLSPSAAVFASEIAENRSPITLLISGENVLQSALMIVLCVVGFVASLVSWKCVSLLVVAVIALVAERNFVLFLPVFFAVCCSRLNFKSHFFRAFPSCFISLVLIAFTLGLWFRGLSQYDSMVAYQRVPVAATSWMLQHPHSGRLFNDDRAGGYLAFMNPSDSTYIDGRFILKTADFFERYLGYAEKTSLFLHDADSLNIDRVVLPLRYYARWGKLLASLEKSENWHVAFRDSLFVVMDRTKY